MSKAGRSAPHGPPIYHGRIDDHEKPLNWAVRTLLHYQCGVRAASALSMARSSVRAALRVRPVRSALVRTSVLKTKRNQ